MQSFLQVVLEPSGFFHRGQFGIGHLAASLNDLGFAILGHFHQLLVMFLDQRVALLFGGGALFVEFFAHLSHAIGPRVLAHLYLPFDLGLLHIAQSIFLDDGAVERIGHVGQLGHPLGLFVLVLGGVLCLGADQGVLGCLQLSFLLGESLFRG